jgi:uncharacterized DUF497 family protein
MMITFVPSKPDKTIEDRGIDFVDAAHVFAGLTLEFEDNRKDYGETRFITMGHLQGRMMVVVWTPRGASHYFYEKSQ